MHPVPPTPLKRLMKPRPYIDVPLKKARYGSRVISETKERSVNHKKPIRSLAPERHSPNWPNTQHIKHNDYRKHPKNSEQTPSATLLLSSVFFPFLKSTYVFAYVLIRVHSCASVVKYPFSLIRAIRGYPCPRS